MRHALVAFLSQPTPDTVWALRRAMLAAGWESEREGWGLLTEVYLFMTELAAKTTAREYSHFAAQLDVGAVGGVALQDLLGTEERGAALWRRILLGGISETLMVMAARQYVKAWEGEMGSLYWQSSWHLYAHWWRLSEQLQAELGAEERDRLLMEMIGPLRDDGVSGTVKAALIVRLYQLLIGYYCLHEDI
ncbi:MAG TPA: hypothetical protein VLL52_14110 [Anaerolineae bacterium]|nr:hypothetical protein [Anaerolineae bacterium]